MKYEKPIVMIEDDAVEMVYATGSGSEGAKLPDDLTPGEHQHVDAGDCWSVTLNKDQTVAHEGWCTFRVIANHSRSGEHLSTKTTVTVTFNQTITNARFEGFVATANGSTVVLERESLGDSYKSGDNFNTLLKVWCAEPSTCEPVEYDIKCTKTVNVQGNGGNEI